jgi:hypothetical protein
MRCVGGVAAAVAVAAVLDIAARPALAEAEIAGQNEARFLLFAGTDLWRHGGFGHGGLLWSPDGLNRDGVVLKLAFSGGSYSYISGALGNAEVHGRQLAASVLPGWRFVRPGFVVTVFAGLDVQNHELSPDDPSAGLRGSYYGVRTGFELWYEPTANTMVAADASLSSVGPSYSARLAAGLRWFGWWYVGPEIQGFAADDNYRQVRAGVHVTGFRTRAVEWSAGFGWANDSDDRSSLYGKLGIIARR